MNLLSYINRIYDITSPISKKTMIYPGDVKPSVKIQQDYDAGGFRVSALEFGSHTGTHMDAPKHVIEDGMGIDELPLERLMGPVCVVEVSPGEIQKSYLPKDLLPGDSIFFKTCPKPITKSPSPCKMQSDDLSRESYKSSDSYLGLEAALFLYESGVKTVGTDCLSIESTKGDGSIHRFLLSKSIVIIEGLELSHIPPKEYFFICLPLKIQGCDGAPARALLIE